LILALVLALGEILVRRLQLGWIRARPTPIPVNEQPISNATTTPQEMAAVVSTPSDPSAAPPPDEGLHEALRQLRKKR
jgi:hypothetical protein